MCYAEISFMKDVVHTRIVRRLAPLYIAAFFHGFVLWYAIEKLFMHQIGFNDAGIGVMVAAYSVVVLLCETPSGILADRWSRKGVLMLASGILALSGLMCGLSTEPGVYIAGALVWGVFYALYSGTYDSVIYDVVKEETGSGEAYDKYFGRFRMVDSAALVLGALCGGVIGEWLGLPATYFFSVPLAFISVVALWKFVEPQLHKEDANENMLAHVKETFKLVLGRRQLLPLVILLTVLYLIAEILYEFAQLWYIALDTPAAFMGPAFAVVLAASGLSGFLAGVVATHSRKLIVGTYVALIASSVALVFVPQIIVVVAAEFILAVAFIGLEIITKRDLHDQLPSRVRAGASSALGTTSRLLLVPIGLLFGWLSAQYSVFNAAWVLVVLSVVALVLELTRPKLAPKG